jgi:cbb3-type cytochrome oxidase subunit 3
MTFQTDTLIYDAKKIAEYQADKRFDYNSQLEVPDFNPIEWIMNWLTQMLTRFFNYSTAESVARWIIIIVFILVILLVIYFIYKKRPELFMREKKSLLPYEVEEENIYRIDFEKELAEALSIGDFRISIRILYLQTIRFLADKQWIDWKIFKTPTEYTYELKPANLKTPFRDFTNRFLQVRYGNFKATRELFDSMCRLRDELTKGGNDEGE